MEESISDLERLIQVPSVRELLLPVDKKTIIVNLLGSLGNVEFNLDR